MESVKNIIKGSTARLTHICEGKVYYRIETGEHTYQLEIDSCTSEWKATYLMPEFKSIHLMRWIRMGIESGDGSFIKLR